MQRFRQLSSGGILLLLALASVAAGAQAQPKPHTIQTIYVMPSSHWDLGFLAPPEEILPRLKPHLDEVIANAKADPEFRWTVESVWQVREWLARTEDPAKRRELADLINHGQIQLSAAFGSMHTEFMGAEALNRIAYDMKTVEKQLGVKTDFAMMDDVPGFTLRLPQVLAGSGIRYFVNGSNLFISGGTSLSPGHVPFYWQSPDGSRILTWQTQGHLGGYTEAMADYFLDPYAIEPYTREHFYPKEWAGLPPLEIMQRGVDKLLDHYESAGYPYDAVLVLDLHDFISSNLEANQLLPAIRAWNAAGKSPRIQVCIPAEFFRHLESRYGSDRFETHAGDWSGLWSEVKTNSPVISANARWLHDQWPVAETVWSLLTFRNFTNFPSGNLDDMRYKLFKYDEHSGSGQTGWPKLMTRAETDQQNSEYANYTASGAADVQGLLDSGLRTLLSQKPATARTVAVFNPASWTRTDVAVLQSKVDVSLRDVATGKLVPSQRLSPTEVAFLASDVPSLGYRSYTVEPRTAASAKPASASTSVIESAFYRLRVNSADGSIESLFDKSLRQELAPPPGKGINQLLRWSAAAEMPVGLGQPVLRRESGPLLDRIVIARPGTLWPETTLTLYHPFKRVAISNELDRTQMPFVASNQPGEYYSFNFPVRFTGSSTVWVEDGIGYHRIPDDYLPGARTDGAVPQHSLVLEGNLGGSLATVTLAQRQAFFDYLPGLPGAKGPNTFLNVVRATVLRKQDQGDTKDLGIVNFPTVEPGLPSTSTYDFTMTSAAGKLDAVASYREGVALNLPLTTVELSSGTQPADAVGSYFSLSAPNATILAFKPSTDGAPEDYTLRLQEVAGQSADVEIRSALKISAAAITSTTEDEVLRTLAAAPLRVTLKPHELLTLRLTIPHPHKQRSDKWWEW